MNLIVMIIIVFFLLESTMSVESDNVVLEKNDRYIVLQIARLGLANRLRTMADWHTISLISERILLVSWEETLDCNISFAAMFDQGPPTLKLLSFHLPIGNEGEKTVARMASLNNMTYLNLDLDSSKNLQKNFLMNPNDVNSDIQVVYTSYDGIVALEGISPQQYLNMRSSFLSSLIPNQYILNTINNIITNHFQSYLMIGVHIRVHDPRYDWEVVPPRVGSESAVEFGSGASIKDFERIMTQMKQKFNSYSFQHEKQKEKEGEWKFRITPTIRFFITSNDESVKQDLLQKFPDSISVRGETGEGGRDTREGMQTALIEFLLLSHTALIINTYGSTYAVEAAQLRMIPVVGIWGGVLLHHTSVRLPYGGHMQFAAAYGPSTPRIYREGTVDNREVHGAEVKLSDCPQLTDWGLGLVYCLN